MPGKPKGEQEKKAKKGDLHTTQTQSAIMETLRNLSSKLHGTSYGKGSGQTFWRDRQKLSTAARPLRGTFSNYEQTGTVESDVKSLHANGTSNLNMKLELLETKLFTRRQGEKRQCAIF